MAMANENGIDMINARNDVSRVPSRNGKAPYTLLIGSQVRPHRYFRPRDFIDGMDSTISVSNTPSISTTMDIPITTRDRLKIDSALIFPLETLFALVIASVVSIAI